MRTWHVCVAAIIVACVALLGNVFGGDFTHYVNPFAGATRVAAGHDGSVWFKSGAYFVRFRPDTEELTVFPLESAYAGDVAVDQAGAAWFHSVAVVYRVWESQMQVFMFPDSSGGGVIAPAPDGSVWASMLRNDPSFRSSLLRFRGDTYEEMTVPADWMARTISFDSSGAGWFTYSELAPIQLAKYENEAWVTFSDIPSWDAPTCAAAGAAGELWIDWLCETVRVLQDGVVVHEYGPSDGLAGHTITGIAIDVFDRVWVSDSHSGVSMFDRQDWSVFNTLNSGLPSDTVWDAAPADDGSVFFATTAGLARYKDGLWSAYTGGESTVMNNDIWSVNTDQRGYTSVSYTHLTLPTN